MLYKQQSAKNGLQSGSTALTYDTDVLARGFGSEVIDQFVEGIFGFVMQ
jgi:hypothetical protein